MNNGDLFREAMQNELTAPQCYPGHVTIQFVDSDEEELDLAWRQGRLQGLKEAAEDDWRFLLGGVGIGLLLSFWTWWMLR